MPTPAARPRPSGGFNTGFGSFNDSFEQFDDQAMSSAVQQKAMTQQQTSSAQPQTGGSALGGQTPQAGAIPATPRPLGSITEELVNRPVKDVVKGLASLFDINSLLGIHPESDDPQTQAKKKQMLSRWQNLDAKQREVAQKRYQEELQKKKQAEEQAQAEKQQQEEAKKAFVMPAGKSDGPVGPGGTGRKPAAVAQMEQDRKTLGGPKSVN